MDLFLEVFLNQLLAGIAPSRMEVNRLIFEWRGRDLPGSRQKLKAGSLTPCLGEDFRLSIQFIENGKVLCQILSPMKSMDYKLTWWVRT
jgi:hypothetical protein